MGLHAVAGHLLRQAHAVLLPAFAEPVLDDALREFLGNGGRSLLLGETREEYVARRMTDDRLARETATQISTLSADAVAAADGAPILLAVDFELAGIQRLPGLVPALPARPDLATLSDDDLEAVCRRTALGLRDLGVNLVLSPIADVLDAPNPWLDDRHLGPDPALVRRVVSIYVRAFEASGVATTVKHFPGHRGLGTDPAVSPEATVPGDRTTAEADLAPFRAAFAEGASAVMTGPGTVLALDPDLPAVLSPTVIGLLRSELAFDGLVISDGLDMAAIRGDRTIEATAIEALAAGNDLLLVDAAHDLTALATAIASAVTAGQLSAGRLADAAARVERVADVR